MSELNVENIQGLDPNLAYLFYVDARDQKKKVAYDDWIEKVRLLQKALGSLGIKSVIIPVFGDERDLKIYPVEIKKTDDIFEKLTKREEISKIIKPAIYDDEEK